MLTETKEATEAARGPLHVYSYRANYIHTHAEEASQWASSKTKYRAGTEVRL